MRNRVFVSVSCFIMGVVWVGCDSQKTSSESDSKPKSEEKVEDQTQYDFTRPELPAPPSQAFVGSAVCRDCHSEISDHYAHHPMGRSMGPVLEVEQIENYGADAGFKMSSCTKGYG